MTRQLLAIREETLEEKKLREWFENQALESPKTMEEVARLLIGLITGLLGVLFSVLAVAAEQVPVYITLPLVRWAGVSAVGFWLTALMFGLAVIIPRRWQVKSGRPQTEHETFNQILAHKSGWLTAALIFFGLGTTGLAVALIAALLNV